MTVRTWIRKLFAPRTPRTIRKTPARRHLRLELLEDRVVLSGGQILPLHPPGASPYGMSQPDLPTAEVTGLYNLILGRTPDTAEVKGWTSLLQRGVSPTDVVQGFLASPEYQASLVQTYYQNFLNRSAEQPAINPWTAVLGGDTDTTKFTIGITTSAEYQQLHSTNTAFVQSLYANILGREAASSEVEAWSQSLAGGTSREQVTLAFVTSTESVTQSVQQFYQVFFQRDADPAGLTNWVAQARSQPLSLVLGQILSSPEFPFRAAAGLGALPASNLGVIQPPLASDDPPTTDIQPPAIPTVPITPTEPSGQPFSNFFGFNQHTLVSDAGLVPMGSPWDNSLVFPSVSYDATATGTAVQPTLQLPAELVSKLDLKQGGTFQFWFQAKNPGVLLSANIPTTGETATGTYPAPLIYIDANGKIVAGLFDQTALSVVPNQHPLSWLDTDMHTQIGAAHPLISQVGVLDNTWHHVALVFSEQSEALYVDGVLQEMSQPQYHQTNTYTSSNNNMLQVPLVRSPKLNQEIAGTIAQVNPAGTPFAAGGTSEIYRFQGWLDSSGNATIILSQPANSPTVTVESVTYSSGSLTFTLSGNINSANALTIDVAYLTPDSAYSFKPDATSTWSKPINGSTMATFGDVTGLTVGGTIVPEPTANLHPAMNYPQGFVGTVDEVALWNTMLTQPQVQSAMSGPVGGPGGKVPGDLVGYFPFTQTVPGKTNEWPNDVPGATSFATGPTQGTRLSPVSSTIPTDPFPEAIRLPGARAWGLHLMTPLASSAQNLEDGITTAYKVGLAAGDQLAISVPQSERGMLTIVLEDDLGRKSPPINLPAGSPPQYLVAARTGTYQLTLTWEGSGSPPNGKVIFEMLPGPLNSLMELFSSYAQGVSSDQAITHQAYSDPSLPSINPTVKTPEATAAANYWPLWSDQTYFPLDGKYQPADLRDAYTALVGALNQPNNPNNPNNQLSDFANIIGGLVTNPSDIQNALNTAYQQVYSKAPPTPPLNDPAFPAFPVRPAATPEDAVYEFFYNANLLRTTVYAALTGTGSDSVANLQNWVQRVRDSINDSTVPLDIATTIAQGQGQQVQTITVNAPLPSQTQPVGEILLDGLIAATAGFLAALPGLGEGLGALGLLSGFLAGAGGALTQSFVGNAYASSSTTNFQVPVTAITNSVLNYEQLNLMADSIQAGAEQLWDNIYNALTTDALAQSVLSNYGLLKAFSVMSGAPLSLDGQISADVTTSLKRTSWQQMIPATFQWGGQPALPVAPHAFPTGNGQTNDWVASDPYSLTGTEPDLNGITHADFNKDGKLDLAVANYGTSDVSLLLGAAGGTFQTAINVGLNGPDGARGIISGDFNDDGNPDLVVSNFTDDELSLLLGDGRDNRNGQFQQAQTIGLNGPNGPWGMVSGDFMNSTGKQLDLAVADYSSGEISILINKRDGTGNFLTPVTVPVKDSYNPVSIAAGDFDKDGKMDLAVTTQKTGFFNASPGNVQVLFGNGDGSFQNPLTIYTPSDLLQPTGIVAGDLNGDGISDIAVTLQESNLALLGVLLSNGNRTFQVSVADSALVDNSFDTGFSGIALQPTVNGAPNLVVTSADTNALNVYFNNGGGGFSRAIRIPLPDSTSTPRAITVADFAGNGLGQAAIANHGSSNVVLLSPTGVGNTATFLPGTSTSNIPLSGPTSLNNTIDLHALDNLLTQMQALQGGNMAFLGPFNRQSLITPTPDGIPIFMAFTSLTYSDELPLSLNAPGMFLSLSPATLTEAATDTNNGNSLTYTQNGVYLAGWQLLDKNNNPIAPGTVELLFGTPSIDPNSKRPVGLNLTPANPDQPFAAFNGGWYFDAEPASGGAATWEEVFFDWGLGTSGYSPRNLVPQKLSGTLPNTKYDSQDPGQDIAYTLSFQPATDSPLVVPGVPVNLTSSFNRTGIVNDGSSFSSSGGIDLAGNALSGTLLGGTVIANHTQFTLGSLGNNNVISAQGQTIALPGGSFSELNLLGLGLGRGPGENPPLTFTMRYTDGTTTSFTQQISDWFIPKNNPGETIAATMPYRDNFQGGITPGSFYVYAYRFALNKDKTVESVTLPNDPDTIILSVTLT